MNDAAEPKENSIVSLSSMSGSRIIGNYSHSFSYPNFRLRSSIAGF